MERQSRPANLKIVLPSSKLSAVKLPVVEIPTVELPSVEHLSINITLPSIKITSPRESPLPSPFLRYPSTTPTKLPVPKTPSKLSSTCLQCHLASLRCSYTSHHHLRQVQKSKIPIVSCIRCESHQEGFCIRRLPKEVDESLYEATEWEKFDFVADKLVEVKEEIEVMGLEGIQKMMVKEEVDREVVIKKVIALKLEKEEVIEWMLPRPEFPLEVRTKLKSVSLRFVEAEEEEELEEEEETW